MDLVKEEKKKRLTGIIAGAILPIVLFLIMEESKQQLFLRRLMNRLKKIFKT